MFRLDTLDTISSWFTSFISNLTLSFSQIKCINDHCAHEFRVNSKMPLRVVVVCWDSMSLGRGPIDLTGIGQWIFDFNNHIEVMTFYVLRLARYFKSFTMIYILASRQN